MKIRGLPYESGGTVSAPPGARIGWQVIRDQIASGNPYLGENPPKVVPVEIDSGASSWEACTAIKQESASIGKALWLGGDHTVTYGVISAFSEPFDMFIIDAHDDMMPDEGKLHQVSWLWHAMQATKVEHVTMYGVRTDKSKHPRISHTPVESALGQLRTIHNHARPFYISVDIDGLDPSVAPGTGNPVPDGFRNVNDLTRTLAQAFKSRKCLGMDIVEYNPLLDPSRQTCHLIMAFISELLSA